MKHIGIPEAVVDQYWTRPFSELARLAADGIDGICDADQDDRAKWEQTDHKGERYDGLMSEEGRRRMRGYAIMREGAHADYRRPDVATLWIQNFSRRAQG